MSDLLNEVMEDKKLAELCARACSDVEREIAKTIVGQREVVRLLLISLFAKGHGLFIGVPGLAKTMLIHTLADSLDLGFKRVQFTPDLMPSDITGTNILEEDQATGKRDFKFVRGPVFTNILLADEINRTSPKTQAALLQAMQEYKISAGGEDHELETPFLVFATQNPIEQEGTYPLPEAQLDRFMFSIMMEYPTAEEELEIVRRTTSGPGERVRKVLDPGSIKRFQELVPQVPVADVAIRYAVDLVRQSRPGETTIKNVRDLVGWGAGPRGAQHLILGAKARALLDGRFAAGVEDVKALAPSVLSHRMVINFRGEAQGVKSQEIIEQLLGKVPVA